MSSSLHARSRRLAQFLNCLSWFLAKTQQYCSVRAFCLPMLLQRPGEGKLSLRLYVVSQALSLPNYTFLASVWGPARRSLTVPALKKLLFPPHVHTRRPVRSHTMNKRLQPHFSHHSSCILCIYMSATAFFILLGPTRCNGWPAEQRLENPWQLRAEERPWLGICSSTCRMSERPTITHASRQAYLPNTK